MRVAVDARHLLSGRGVARHLRRTLEAAPRDRQWRAVVPGRGPVAPIPGVELVRHRLGSRPLYGAAALARRPRLETLAGGADVAWVPAPAPVSVGVDYVLTLHDLSWEQRPADFTAYERAWHRIARPRALALGARRVVAVSAATAAVAAERSGVTAAVIHQGRHRPPPGIAAHAGDYLLFVGALEPRKAPDALMRAFARARPAGLELLIVGRGRLEDELRRLAVPGVRLLGTVDDTALHGLYAGARAIVAPSLLEGYGLVALEAALHGTGAIVSDLPVFRELLGDGALYVAPGDEDALAQALIETPPAPTADPPTWQQSAAALAELLHG